MKKNVALLLSLMTVNAHAGLSFDLNDAANVVDAPSASANVAGPLANFLWKPLKIEDVQGKPGWKKLINSTGGSGYIQESALKKTEIQPNIEIRDAKGKVLGSTSDHKTNLVFTGRKEILKGRENLEAWMNGQTVWVPNEARSVKSVNQAKSGVPQTAKAPERRKPTSPGTRTMAEIGTLDGSKKQLCVNTYGEFKANERLTKAFQGENPFENWSGSAKTPMGDLLVSLKPAGGTWKVEVPQINFSENAAIKVCVDKRDRPFVSYNGNKAFFNDRSFRTITVNHQGYEAALTRGGGSRRSAGAVE